MPDNTSFFNSDRPLEIEAEVFPERRVFAKQVSKAIVNWRGQESCVVALNGAWGSGKTTVKNLILTDLQSQSPPIPVLEFNPWQWNGSDQLWSGFLAELGEKLTQGIVSDKDGGAEQAEEKNKKAATSWRRFSLLLTGAAGLTRTSKWLVVPHGIDPQSIDTLAAGLDSSAALAKGTAEDKMTEDIEPDKPLNEIKRSLSDTFRELKQPILVVMDDLDRLAPSELKEIIQLIKANADFPNVIYLLLFQREIVEKSLQVALKIDGEKYLEKIVQVPLDIPATRPSQIVAQVEQRLQSVIGNRWQDTISSPRWGLFYPNSVMAFFQTMRDVNRFFSSFSFLSAGILQEVNPIDFLALELLRFFEKDVYQAIAISAKLLIKPPPSNGGILLDIAKQQATDLLHKASPARQDIILEMIVMLFPEARALYEAASFFAGDSSASRFHDLRVCIPILFERYFIYDVPPEDVTRAEIVSFLDTHPSYEEVVRRLQEARQRGLFEPFLSHLAAAIQSTIVSDPAALFQALFNEVEQDYLTGAGNEDACRTVFSAAVFYIVKARLEGIPVLEQALRDTSACYVPCFVVHHLQTENSWQYLGFGPPSASVWKDLTQLCAGRIAKSAKEGHLPKHRMFWCLLLFWQEWDKDSANTYLAHQLTPEEALTLAKKCWDDARELLDLDSLEKVIPLPMLMTKLSTLDGDDLSDQDQALMKVLEKCIEAKAIQPENVGKDPVRHMAPSA